MLHMAVFASEWPLSAGFNAVKASQMIAFFVRKAGASIEKLKLTKLVYLAERLSFERRSAPMNFDEFYSMPHGPVPSSALNVMDGKAAGLEAGEVMLVGNLVSVSDNVRTDHLSRNDLDILNKVWSEFGHMGALQIRNWTHTHCEEYVEVTSGRLSISYDEILEAVGAERPVDTMKELRFLQREVDRLPKPHAG